MFPPSMYGKLETSPYHLRLHGTFEVTRRGGEVVWFPARSASAAIAYLYLSGSRFTSRKEMATNLWPDSDPTAAMTSLRTAIHRCRKAVPGWDPFIIEGDLIRLNREDLSSDIADADVLHKVYALASHQPDGIQAIKEEWEIRKSPLLVGWEEEWIENFRMQADVVAVDVGAELATQLEASGDAVQAVAVWNEVLDKVPHHADALKNALRLTYQLHGKGKAIELANSVTASFHADLGIEMPAALQKTLKAIRSGILEPIPRPELIKTRGELMLLARMFESNLNANRKEALTMLSVECASPLALVHPRAMLSLLTLALGQTDGVFRERLEVAAQTISLASLASEFETGHIWADFVLANMEKEDPLYGNTLGLKGFMHFEQRQYALAETYLGEAVAIAQHFGKMDEVLRAQGRLAGVWWHQLRFEEAIAAYNNVYSSLEHRSDPDATRLKSMAMGNLCFVHTFRQEWETALGFGRKCLEAADQSHYVAIVQGPYGLAQVGSGDIQNGVRHLIEGLSSSCREGMRRFNQITIDFASVALCLMGNQRAAECLAQANIAHRAVLNHFRSPVEAALIEKFLPGTNELDPKAHATNPLIGQSAITLSQWACESLEKMAFASVN